MKFSYQWLRALSGTEKGPKALAQDITVRAFEVEEMVDMAAALAKVVVGHVVAVNAHPNADRLRVAQVDVGAGEDLQIVCGAPNLAQGQKVPVALVGAVLPTDDGTGFKIKKSKIRGVESCGMICAEDELGLGDDHEGIMVLSEDAQIGMSFAQHIGRDDVMMEIDILPNRAHDALSHEGVAREIAAIEGRALTLPPLNADTVTALAESGSEGLVLEDIAPQCHRYTVTVIAGVDATVQTPAWMVARLEACGLRTINPVVDITNYVMLETGQPLHAFDAVEIADGETVRIGVRPARDGEDMLLLDDRAIALASEDLVITGNDAPVALAGVMGGKESGVTAQSTRIVLEVASFDAATIRAMRARHGIVSDAAFRFERDIDPHCVERARIRAIEFITKICGGHLVSAAEHDPSPQQPWTVRVAHSAVTRLLGTQIAQEECAAILERLDIRVAHDGGEMVCTIPTVRRDVRTAEDVIEEIGRLYGYERIVPQPLRADVVAPEENAQRTFEHRTRDLFAAGGFDEVKGYSAYSARDAEVLGLDADAHVALLNPLNEAYALMRRTLVPALLSACAKNRTHTDNAQIFEIGRTYIAKDDALPREHTVLGAAAMSKAQDAAQFFVLKGMIDEYLAHCGITQYTYDDACADGGYGTAVLHPSRRACIRMADGTVVGMIGEVRKQVLKHYGIKNARVAVCEIDLNAVRTAEPKHKTFTALSKYPTVERDLSMVVGAQTRVADVERVLSAAGGQYLRSVDLFDLYANDKTGQRAMAFRCTFGAQDRTLTGAEVDEAIAAMITAVEEDPDITVRR